MARDYKDEYKKFQSSRKAKKHRASRNLVRAWAEKAGQVKKGDGNEVHHVNGDPLDNSPSNLRVVSRSWNRAKK